jgi:MFS family permease
MAVLSIVAIVCCGLAIIISKDNLLLYLVTLVLGGAAFPMYSICVAYANDRLEPNQIVAASGSLVMISGTGAMTGPIVIAFFMDFFHIDFYFWGIGAVFAFILLFTLIRINSRAGIAIEDQSSLVAGPIGTPIAEYLAPDSLQYAQAVANDEIEQLDQLDTDTDQTERQL